MRRTGNHKQDEKTTLRMGENICKESNRQRINLQNTQTAHGAQYQKNKNKQMGPNETSKLLHSKGNYK